VCLTLPKFILCASLPVIGVPQCAASLRDRKTRLAMHVIADRYEVFLTEDSSFMVEALCSAVTRLVVYMDLVVMSVLEAAEVFPPARQFKCECRY
jgi:hypothetical protein